MRLYKIEMLVTDDRTGEVNATEYYVEKSRDVRAILSRLYKEPGIEVTKVVATPEFEWQNVEVS